MGVAVDGCPAEAKQRVVRPGRVETHAAKLGRGRSIVAIKCQRVAGADARLVAQDTQFLTGFRILLDQRCGATVFLCRRRQLFLARQCGSEVDVPECALLR